MKIKLMIAAAVAAVGLTQIASAVPSSPGLYLVDVATGDNTFVALTGNYASYSGTLGDYDISISVSGVTLGSAGDPYMDLDIGNAQTSDSSDSLEVFYSDGLFGPTAGSYILTSHGPSLGSSTSSAYLASTVFGETTGLGTIVADPGSLSGSINLQDDYYLTIETVVTGTTVSEDTSLTVPDGGTTVGLLGLALAGCALVGRKMRKLA